MSDSGATHTETLEREQQKLSRNSNDHNFSHGCPIPAHNKSRRSKLNNGSSRGIQMVITFNSKVRFKRIICRDARNWTTKPLEKLKWHNFWFGCPIQGHNLSRCSKLNNRSTREIQMVITFRTEFRFGNIIYRNARNWTMEALEKFKWSHSDVRFRYIIYRDARNWITEGLEKFEWSLLFSRMSHFGT